MNSPAWVGAGAGAKAGAEMINFMQKLSPGVKLWRWFILVGFYNSIGLVRLGKKNPFFSYKMIRRGKDLIFVMTNADLMSMDTWLYFVSDVVDRPAKLLTCKFTLSVVVTRTLSHVIMILVYLKGTFHSLEDGWTGSHISCLQYPELQTVTLGLTNGSHLIEWGYFALAWPGMEIVVQWITVIRREE